MVVATAPLGLSGAVAALLLFDQPFGFVALLGLIGLAAVLAFIPLTHDSFWGAWAMRRSAACSQAPSSHCCSCRHSMPCGSGWARAKHQQPNGTGLFLHPLTPAGLAGI